MTLKAELEAENATLKEAISSGTVIKDCVFHGSPSGDVCKAVTEIAIALKHAAKALAGHTSVAITAHSTETDTP